MSGLWEELRRRRVVRVTGVYAVVAFVVLQVGDLVIEPLGLPDWTMTLLVVLAALGLPVAVGLAWALDVTPDGIRRDVARPADEAAGDSPARKASDPAGGAGTFEAGPPRLPGRAAGWAGLGILIGLVGFGGYAYVSGGGEAMGDRSVAVLPLADLSEARDQEYFADGITEDILTRLAGVEALRVISRTSVMGYRGTTRSTPEIGRELGVSFIVEGSVRRAGDRVRVTAQLIRAASDEHLWAANFDRRVEDVFSIQSEIASEIARALEVELGAETRQRLERHGTADLMAYDLYLRGRQQFFRNYESTADLAERARDAMALFRRALEVDPDYALPHVGIARAFLADLEAPPGIRYDSALAYARRAIELDPDLPDALVQLGDSYAARGHYDAALDQYRAALRRNAHHARAIAAVAGVHQAQGRYDQAVRQYQRAIELEPLNGEWYVMVGTLYLMLDDTDRAERWYRRGIGDVMKHEARMEAYDAFIAMARGDQAAARRHAERLLALEPASYGIETAGRVFLFAGEYARARAFYEEYQRLEPLENMHPALAYAARETGDTAAYHRHLELARDAIHRDLAADDPARMAATRLTEAALAAVTGDAEATAVALERAAEVGFRAPPLIESSRLFGGVRNHSRVAAVLERMRHENAVQLARLEGVP